MKTKKAIPITLNKINNNWNKIYKTFLVAKAAFLILIKFNNVL